MCRCNVSGFCCVAQQQSQQARRACDSEDGPVLGSYKDTFIMDRSTIKWLLLGAIAICGMLGYKVAMHASNTQTKQQPEYTRPEPRFGVVTAILYCEDEPMILMEDQILHEGGLMHDVKILKIHADKVEFEKSGEKWDQRVQEAAKPQWWKRNGKEKDEKG